MEVAPPSVLYVYAAMVVAVHDGDTITAVLDYGFHQTGAWNLRINHLYCPELSQPGGPEARDYARELCLDKRVTVRTHRTKTGNEVQTLGRYVADVWLPDGSLLSYRVVAAGHGTVRP